MLSINRVRRAIEKLIAPHAILSYSSAGEDLVLDFLTDYLPTGFYVDVGCNHARQHSNTYRFYRKGWSGIAIDANAAFEREFARTRPRDQFIRACVSDKVEDVKFHHFHHDTLSSVSGAHFYDNDEHYALERIETMTTRRLDDILAEANCPERFDILNVDVEGMDEAVLRSLDLKRFQPRVILVELNGTDLDVGRLSDSGIAKSLEKFGYSPVAIHWGNGFFRRA